MDGKRNRLARAAMGQADIRCQHAMREARERLLGRVRVNRAQAAEVACIERLQEVERFCPTHLSNEDAIRAMAERRAEQVGNRDRREGRLLAERWLRAARFES
jgi:hypothetical protein